MKSINAIDRLAIAVSILILAAAAWVALYGPTTPVPLHFNTSGEADRYGSRLELAAILATVGVLNMVVSCFTSHQSKHAADPVRSKSLRNGQLMSVLIMAAVAVMIGWTSLGPQAATGTNNMSVTLAFVSAICVLAGAMLGKVGPNPFIGVKTPWAYKSRLAWDKSNRLAGRLLFILGLIGLAASPFAPQPVATVAFVISILGAAAWSVHESWRVWRNDPEAQSF